MSLLNTLFVPNALPVIFIIVLVSLLIKKFVNRQTVQAINKLPGLKLRFYHVLGHLDIRERKKLQQLPLPIHVYDFIGILGYNILFKKSGIAHAWQFYYPFVSVFKADLVEGILNHSTEIKKAWFYDFLHPWLGSGLLTSHGDKWRHRRKLLTPAFHFNILKDFQPVLNKHSNILVEILDNHTQDEFIDIVPFVTLCSLDVICESILGKELHSQTQPSHPYLQAVQALTDAVFERMHSPWLWSDYLFSILPFGKKFGSNKNVLHEFTNQMIAEKKREKLQMKNSVMPLNINCADDDIQYKRKKRALLDLLLDEHIENNSITEDEIREEVDTFTFEGHDTTSMGMSWTLYLIGLHPWIQEKIHNELDFIFGGDVRDATDEDLINMKYLECVIKESLRLYPSVPAYGREVTEDLDINGFIIPKGSTCMVNAYLLHRDPENFPNPEKFDPERFSSENISGRHPFAYVPFSAGPRNCIGQKFALMEEKTILSSVLRRFKLRSLDARDQIHLVNELVLRPYKGLRIQIRRRNQDFDFHTVYYRP